MIINSHGNNILTLPEEKIQSQWESCINLEIHHLALYKIYYRTDYYAHTNPLSLNFHVIKFNDLFYCKIIKDNVQSKLKVSPRLCFFDSGEQT